MNLKGGLIYIKITGGGEEEEGKATGLEQPFYLSLAVAIVVVIAIMMVVVFLKHRRGRT
ncbi:MAG: hypothetical protein J7L38_04635 [Thermoproteales archaeon]|nr:hypothetical protein [Thermoproteales archaeon]